MHVISHAQASIYRYCLFNFPRYIRYFDIFYLYLYCAILLYALRCQSMLHLLKYYDKNSK